MRDKEILTIMMQINSLNPGVWMNAKLRLNPDNCAFVILPGPRSHNYREENGCEIWLSLQKREVSSKLLIAGIREEPKIKKDDILKIIGKKNEMNLFLKDSAEHTKEQMQWVLDTLENEMPRVQHIVLSTAIYHLPRGFLTLLKEMINRRLDHIVSTVPLFDTMNPERDFTGIKETGGNGIEGEIDRIVEYQKKGDVATIREYLEYMKIRLNLFH